MLCGICKRSPSKISINKNNNKSMCLDFSKHLPVLLAVTLKVSQTIKEMEAVSISCRGSTSD